MPIGASSAGICARDRGKASNIEVHGHGEDARVSHPIENNGRVVGRTLIDALLLNVGPQRALLHIIRRIPVRPVGAAKIHVRARPCVIVRIGWVGGRRSGVTIGGTGISDPVNTVLRIQPPAQRQLFMVVQALNPLGF